MGKVGGCRVVLTERKGPPPGTHRGRRALLPQSPWLGGAIEGIWNEDWKCQLGQITENHEGHVWELGLVMWWGAFEGGWRWALPFLESHPGCSMTTVARLAVIRLRQIQGKFSPNRETVFRIERKQTGESLWGKTWQVGLWIQSGCPLRVLIHMLKFSVLFFICKVSIHGAGTAECWKGCLAFRKFAINISGCCW